MIYAIIVLTMTLAILGVLVDYSNRKYFDDWKKLLFYGNALVLISLSIQTERSNMKEKSESEVLQQDRFINLSEKLTELEAQNSFQQNVIASYQDSISVLSRKLDSAQGLLIKTLTKQKKVTKEDEILAYISTELYPLVNSLKTIYLKCVSKQRTNDDIYDMLNIVTELPQRAMILKQLSITSSPAAKNQIDNYFRKFSFLLKPDVLMTTFKDGIEMKGDYNAVPSEFMEAASYLNAVTASIVNWKRETIASY